MPAVRAARSAPRVARGFVYVLLLVVCTATAAYGGYVVGSRTQPAPATAATQIGEPAKASVAKAVAAQRRADRAKRRQALIDFAQFQRERFAAELQRKLDAQHITDGRAAARAYPPGKKPRTGEAQQAAAEKAPQAGRG